MKTKTIILLNIIVIFWLSACASTEARNYAAILAAETIKLNNQVEHLTKYRQNMYGSMDRLSKTLELSTLEIEHLNARTLTEWETFKNAPKYKEKIDQFRTIRTHVDSAADRVAVIEKLSKDAIKIREESKGERSQLLIETSKNLASLSVEPSLKDKAKFLANYAEEVHKSIKQAKEDAKKTSKNVEEKTADLTEQKILGDDKQIK